MDRKKEGEGRGGGPMVGVQRRENRSMAHGFCAYREKVGKEGGNNFI